MVSIDSLRVFLAPDFPGRIFKLSIDVFRVADQEYPGRIANVIHVFQLYWEVFVDLITTRNLWSK